MYETYNEDTASLVDQIAWSLCQIIDDDAPMRWTRHRYYAESITRNKDLMGKLSRYAENHDK